MEILARHRFQFRRYTLLILIVYRPWQKFDIAYLLYCTGYKSVFFSNAQFVYFLVSMIRFYILSLTEFQYKIKLLYQTRCKKFSTQLVHLFSSIMIRFNIFFLIKFRNKNCCVSCRMQEFFQAVSSSQSSVFLSGQQELSHWPASPQSVSTLQT